SDFQCPFCSRLATTFDELEQTYGRDLRFVFRHNPLPFHDRAEPAAQLSLEAFARLGHRGFWQAHDRIFAQPRQLEDADLEQIAADLGLSPQRTLQAVARRKHRKRIEADQAWAGKLNARGTPTSYVNGRKVVGARPAADFESVIDEELAKARALVAQGVPPHGIYARLQRGAELPPPPDQKPPAPTP
ncbi:MAG: DsbA family protein, partial [Deltaproteobacteria bacterium]|nr:DsbA family protein [Deltaproteobacteria bacterium]MBW2537267.1 DsbA family protein [Deltaproteobacteria bacterium]